MRFIYCLLLWFQFVAQILYASDQKYFEIHRELFLLKKYFF